MYESELPDLLDVCVRFIHTAKQFTIITGMGA